VAVQRTLDNSYSLACRQGEPGGSGLGDQAALTVLEATVCLIRVLRAELAAARIQIDRAPWVVSPRLPEPPRTCTTTLPSYPSSRRRTPVPLLSSCTPAAFSRRRALAPLSLAFPFPFRNQQWCGYCSQLELVDQQWCGYCRTKESRGRQVRDG
jgi:hypothetical protein